MATDLIRYDLLVQDALRGVVRNVLSEAVRNGLQGDHHFFITYKTNTPGLRLSNRMRERYPDEMTIILQHQFWDLAVTDHAFEVGLSFNNVPERLLIPFAAVTSFVDPSVQFGLKFDVVTSDDAEAAASEETSEPAPKALPGRRGPVAVETDKAPSSSSDSVVALKPHDIKPATPPLVPSAKPASGKGGGAGKTGKPAPEKPAEAPVEAKVLSIDAFRKKPS
ncbi:ClpXP protease specificity-enhancing factor SspB [Lichenihabitans sp. Uapishka_5]|uniref:SspB family protein n=1 Tax=Lichenihabitans sp. Uapishka_5 TaxID=3037302 RepID=UPI0029E81258|nr:ClpXP protease specificity-enhancing factor SspB [Lichenihabitans sp. Uapishka_5]MDX7952573.1 ClpXP protease specificity-enhancing factor SspB [Lichenihabitans sp. Uapishka_5]